MLDFDTAFSKNVDLVGTLVAKTNKSSVLVIQQFPIAEKDPKLPTVRESISNILAFVELGELDTLARVLDIADGHFDHIMMDSDIKLTTSAELITAAQEYIKHSNLFFYSDLNTWADAALQFILQIEKGLLGKRVLVTGQGLLHDLLSSRLQLIGAHILEADAQPIDVLVGCELKSTSADLPILDKLHPSATLYDIGIGNFSEALVTEAKMKAHPVYRIDIRAGLSALIINILETDYLIHKMMGRAIIKDIELVAGGIMGRKDAIIVDDINHPSSIMGVADGRGHIKTALTLDDEARLAFVKRLISQT